MIQFPGDLELEDERVLLRPLQKDDLKFLLPFALNEPEIWTYSSISAAGESGMSAYLEYALREKHLKHEYPFIIFDKLANQYAGSSRFYDIQCAFSTTQLGYTWYGKKFQRTGLNRHCKLLMLSYAFEQWRMERVEFRADLRNNKSIQAMKKIGCTVEGVLRKNMPLEDGRRDSIVLSILKDEWFDTVKKNLQKKIY
jgi:RimJ/RimL family protein N-acetyltransferase